MAKPAYTNRQYQTFDGSVSLKKETNYIFLSQSLLNKHGLFSVEPDLPSVCGSEAASN